MSEAKSIVKYRRIKGFPGYRVGDDGSVWSQLKVIALGRPLGFVSVLGKEWIKLRHLIARKGYRQVTLRRDGESFQRAVHRLVLEAFIGLRPAGKECRHFPDRDPANNALANIAWGTRQQNEQDKAHHQKLRLSRPVARDKKTGRFITRDDELFQAQQFVP